VGREATLKAIFKTPLMYPPRTKTLYSDVDYMLACFVIEKVTGRRLDEYVRETFYEPLGLEHITFLPLENGFAREDCAATELNGTTRDNRVFFPGIRTDTVQGEVHDERAWHCMEGVSGHAGLFASATDLAKLASVMLTGGYGDCRLFSRNVMDSFTAPKAMDYGQWGLGWWRQGDLQRPWYFGTQAAPDTVGHQGWTGTMAMIDPSRELVVVYLTNKINSRVLSDAEILARVEAINGELGDSGRILLRRSGTEPVVRVMAEAAYKSVCEQYVSEIVTMIHKKGYSI
jgi:CubicO group peptidase (beta-lactamase class C family)